MMLNKRKLKKTTALDIFWLPQAQITIFSAPSNSRTPTAQKDLDQRLPLCTYTSSYTMLEKIQLGYWFHFQLNNHNLKSAYKTATNCFSPVLIFLVSIQFPLHMFCLICPYFIYFDATVNAIVFLIETSDCLLLLYRNTLQYYILVLYPANLLKIFISSSSFSQILIFFYIDDHTFCK